MGGEPGDDARATRQEQHRRHSLAWLPALCEKYGCEVVDVWQPWTAYLEEHKLRASAALSDSVHLNALATICWPALLRVISS